MYTRISSSSSSTLSLSWDWHHLDIAFNQTWHTSNVNNNERGVSSFLLLVVLWLKEWLINCCFPPPSLSLSSCFFWKGIEYDRTCQESAMRSAEDEWNRRACRVVRNSHPTIDIYIHTDWKIGCSPRDDVARHYSFFLFFFFLFSLKQLMIVWRWRIHSSSLFMNEKRLGTDFDKQRTINEGILSASVICPSSSSSCLFLRKRETIYLTLEEKRVFVIEE